MNSYGGAATASSDSPSFRPSRGRTGTILPMAVGAGTSTPTPTIWFGVNAERGPFDQLAAALRHRGYRVVRLVHDPLGPRQRRLEGLLYHRVVHLDDLRAGSDGPRPESERIVDFQVTETMSHALAEDDLARFPAEIADLVRTRRALGNKRAVSATLLEHRIRVAEHLPADRFGDAEAIARFGLPIVVKTDVGAAASGVLVATTPDEVAAAVDRFDPSRAGVYFEKLMPGEVRNYAGVIGADGTMLDDVVVRQTGAGAGFRPGREVVDDPQLTAYGRAICAALQHTGPFDLEVIRDGGRPRLIDFNPRAWGSMMSMQAVGIDFASAYLRGLGLAEHDGSQPAKPPAGTFAVFPDEIDQLVTQGRIAAAARAFIGRALQFGRRLGVRYLAHLVALRLLYRLEGAPGSATLPDAASARPAADV